MDAALKVDLNMHAYMEVFKVHLCMHIRILLGYGNNGILYRHPGLRKSMPQYLMH
jgi:hypothetical protein